VLILYASNLALTASNAKANMLPSSWSMSMSASFIESRSSGPENQDSTIAGTEAEDVVCEMGIYSIFDILYIIYLESFATHDSHLVRGNWGENVLKRL
jgi:hypothetical protein